MFHTTRKVKRQILLSAPVLIPFPQPVVLTVNGKAAIVVQDAESYQKLLEPQERSEVVEILRQRLASRNRKKGRPAEDFFNEFFAANNIPVED